MIDAFMGHSNLGKDTEIFVISVHLHLHTTIDRLDVLNETSHESEESRDVRAALASWRVLGSGCSASTLCALLISRTIASRIYV